MEKKIKKVKLDPVILKDLFSENEKTVIKTLGKLRSVGNIGYIPELLKLLNQSEKEQVSKELLRFIADVKDPAVIPFIISGLRNPELEKVRAWIVSACWQSGLDYSQDIELFVKLFREGDYATALECFTVIEEAAVKLSPDELDKVCKLVKNKLARVSEDKKPLSLTLIRLLQDELMMT